VTPGEFFLENFAGDLEYHPRRAILYLALSAAALCFWIFSSPEIKFSTIPRYSVSAAFHYSSRHFPSTEIIPKDSALLNQTLLSPLLAVAKASFDSEPRRSDRSGFRHRPLFLWPLLNIGKDIDHTSD